MARRWWTLALGVASTAFLGFSAELARAHAIDGTSSSAEGKHMSIEGPALLTTSDPGAGQTVYMALLNENTVHLTMANDAQQAQQMPVEVWHRCPPAVSSRFLLQTAA